MKIWLIPRQQDDICAVLVITYDLYVLYAKTNVGNVNFLSTKFLSLNFKQVVNVEKARYK
jgi:hypothetical protein